MIIDGRSIAKNVRENIGKRIKNLSRPLTLTHFVGADDPAILSFVKIKKKIADELGVGIERVDVSNLNTDQLIEKIKEKEGKTDGVILQFPLPSSIDAKKAKNSIPPLLDVDVVSERGMENFQNGEIVVLPPVVGAIKEIVDTYKIEIKNKKVLIIGRGLLVGLPSVIWFKAMGADITNIGEEVSDVSIYTKEADIIVLGAGSPGILKPEMIKEGTVIFDAGTSEEGGKLLGDADPDCASKCSFFTPVPGGIGPITVAMIFKNLLNLSKLEERP